MSEVMRAVLIGTGMVAQTHVQAIAATRGRIVLDGVCARTSAAEFARLNGCTAFDDIDALLEAEPDFAIIATPPNARLELVRKLAAAGLPILLEKPIERSLTAARKVVSICHEAQVPLGIVFQHRTRQAVAHLRQSLPELGPLGLVEISVPWWRDQSYYDAPGRGTYAQDGGGVLITQAIHTLDLALSLAGHVTHVQAMARRSALHTMEAEDTVTAGLSFASGAVGSLFATTAAFPGAPEQITLHGTAGVARLTGDSLTLSFRDGREETYGADQATGGGADPMGFTHEWHQAVIEDFADALEEDRAPLVSGREGLRAHALIDALTRSSDQKREVEVADV